MRSDITITRGKLSEGPGPLFLDRTWLPVIKLFHCLIITVVGTQTAALFFPKHNADREEESVENAHFWTLSLASRKPESQSASHEPQRAPPADALLAAGKPCSVCRYCWWGEMNGEGQ